MRWGNNIKEIEDYCLAVKVTIVNRDPASILYISKTFLQDSNDALNERKILCYADCKHD